MSGGTGLVLAVTRVSEGRNSTIIAGPGAEARGAVGYAPANGFALALEGRALIHGGGVSDSNGGAIPALTAVGTLAEWYPEPLEPFHLQLGLARMAASALGGTISSGVDANGAPSPADTSGLTGPFAHVGAGWAWRDRQGAAFTPRIDLYRGRATNDSASLDVYGLTLDLAVTWL